MTKQHLYHIGKPEYFYAIMALTREFYKQNIPVNLVGGAAIQAHIANILSQKTGKSVDNLGLENILRKTDDIDLVSLCNENDVLRILSKINGEEEIGEDAYHIEVIRNGSKRPKVRVNSYEDECEIMVNVSNSERDLKKLDKKHYNATVYQFQPMSLENKGVKAELRVLQPEYVLAAKLKLSREKDLIDIENLIKVFNENEVPLDYEKIREIVGARDYIKLENIKRSLDKTKSLF